MTTPLLYRQLFDQLSQWLVPKDRRHLQGLAEIVGAILQSGSACSSHWLPYLSHRNCQARSHLERISYFMDNPAIQAEQYYAPILRHLLQDWSGSPLLLVLDTSLLWEQYCLIEVCLAWGGRSLVLAQSVLEHGSATVGFEHYRPVLEVAQSVLPEQAQVTLLADRGFEHGELMRWLTQQQWNWAIRAKSDLQVTLATGAKKSVAELLPQKGQAHLFHQVQILSDVSCHLATAHWTGAKEAWAVITNTQPSLQTFALYGRRFGGIEPHFKDYKSGGLGLLRSRLRNVQSLNCLLMLLAIAQLFATYLGLLLTDSGQRLQVDWHGQRGLSFLQLGLRQIQRLCHLGLPLPALAPLPYCNPPTATASHKKRRQLETQVEFSRVAVFF